jgi:hypothetical protein
MLASTVSRRPNTSRPSLSHAPGGAEGPSRAHDQDCLAPKPGPALGATHTHGVQLGCRQLGRPSFTHHGVGDCERCEAAAGHLDPARWAGIRPSPIVHPCLKVRGALSQAHSADTEVACPGVHSGESSWGLCPLQSLICLSWLGGTEN